MSQGTQHSSPLKGAIGTVSGAVFAGIGVLSLYRGFDMLSLLMVLMGLSVAVSPLCKRLGHGPEGSGQVLVNVVLMTAFLSAVGVFAFFSGVDSLRGHQVGGHVIGFSLLCTSALMVLTVGWLGIGVRRSWRRWRG